MEDTKKIRNRNIQAVRQALRSTGGATKLEVARVCGLSQATCNTILNELEQRGEVLADKLMGTQVGRRASLYTLNADYFHMLCLYVKGSHGVKSLWSGILNMEGKVLEERLEEKECLNQEVLLKKAKDYLIKDPKIACISLGIPGGVWEGNVSFCDVEELAGTALKKAMERELGKPVCVEKDMRLIAYGLVKKGYAREHSSLSVILMDEGVCPGTATILNGQIVKGATGLAGEAGYMPCGLSWAEQAERWNADTFFPLALQTTAALIVYLNPECVVISGDLTEAALPGRLYEACCETIPGEHMPMILWIPEIHEFYTEGLMAMARDEMERKERGDL